MLTINEQHQEFNKIAYKLAKGSLSQPSATIPFDYEFLPSVSVCVNHGRGTYVFENQAHKLFTKHYKSLNKHYHFRGQWHPTAIYLLMQYGKKPHYIFCTQNSLPPVP
jgi:hypothetical protein